MTESVLLRSHTTEAYAQWLKEVEAPETIDRVQTQWEYGKAFGQVFREPYPEDTQPNRPGKLTVQHQDPYDYLLYLPDNYEERQDWPLIFFFHGIGERGSDPEILLCRGMPQYLAEGLPLEAVVIAPQCPLESHWADSDVEVEVHLRKFVPEMIARYCVDPSRVYATGLSMGGRCTWKLALAMPEYFAAIAVICGRTNTYEMERLLDIPIWMIHGIQDDVVSFENIQKILDALEAAGHPQYRLTVYPYADHDVWSATYRNRSIYQWLLSHKQKKR